MTVIWKERPHMRKRMGKIGRNGEILPAGSGRMTALENAVSRNLRNAKKCLKLSWITGKNEEIKSENNRNSAYNLKRKIKIKFDKNAYFGENAGKKKENRKIR